MTGADAQASAVQGRHPLVERILAGDAPDAIRLGAARGALPIPQQDLIYVQICLLKDALPAVAQAATDSLAKLTTDGLLPIFRDAACDPIVIDHFARAGKLEGAALEAAVAHPAISDATLESLAAGAPAETLNLIVTNEVRIIRNPRLLELLRANRALRADDRRRLAELERDFVGKDRLEVRGARAGASPVAAPEIAAEAAPIPAEGAEAPAGPPGEEDAPLPVMTAEEERNYEESLRKTPAFMKIMQMTVAEKVQLAMKGTSEERAVLIRDTAKMVALQVLRSPKLGDNEITTFASLRSIHEDVLREIASHRDWTKTYTVAHALVRNPKTPPGLTIQFLPRLGTRDLKMVMGDKNIPELVRRQARNLFLVRTTPPKKLGKKSH
jgi:hypothetical protein